ncbi:MAG: ATP-dependent Clp protease proteolytic subunit [Cyclobacteriaceae bacterium]|jgi:ATP-dependent Clp protease protease subunit|nr:ATP-dependent Clp protease proteolytic subunit [Cyclobacteriaceae bacterium]
MNNEFKKFAVHHLGMSSSNLDRYAQWMQPAVTNMTPNVVEERQMRATVIDVFSRLMADRIVFLGTPVDDYIANVITAQLLFLESADAKKDIIMYINSPGGSVYAGLGIYDTMQYVNPDVVTICTGLAASMGAVLLAAGESKKRSALPHARIMIHQPSAGMQGTSSDMEISMRQTLELKRDLYTILSKHSGQPYEKIEKDSDRDYWMRANEARDYGLIDEVMERKK